MDITFLGHGSLMSGRGLSFSGTFAVRWAGTVALAGCRRGFAKLSMYGNRLATDVELSRLPLEGRVVSAWAEAEAAHKVGIEALALTVSLEDGCRLTKREGYSPEAVKKLATLATDRRAHLADFLWMLGAEVEHDVVAYRQRLFALTGYTSPHYIPHPVRIADGRTALIFLAPGDEGTGSEDVISIRQQTGIRRPMTAGEAWQRKPNGEQLSYFVSCLLGGVHGLGVHDLLPSKDDDPQLISFLTQQLAQDVEKERTLFLETIGFTPARYRQAFGDPELLLRRSGLADFLTGTLRDSVRRGAP